LLDRENPMDIQTQLQFPQMVPLKFSITYEPPQIGLLYKRHPNDKKKQLFVIQLNGLIFLGDPEKITEILFHKHCDYLDPYIVSFVQVKKLVEKLLEYLQAQLVAYEEEEQEIMGDYEEEDDQRSSEPE
jgi:Fe-S-cluster formation regulator IscX/YfhJ